MSGVLGLCLAGCFALASTHLADGVPVLYVLCVYPGPAYERDRCTSPALWPEGCKETNPCVGLACVSAVKCVLYFMITGMIATKMCCRTLHDMLSFCTSILYVQGIPGHQPQPWKSLRPNSRSACLSQPLPCREDSSVYDELSDLLPFPNKGHLMHVLMQSLSIRHQSVCM